MEKQTKMIEDQGKKQIKASEKNEQLVKSNELIKGNYFNIDRDDTPLEKQEEIYSKLLEERTSEFNN